MSLGYKSNFCLAQLSYDQISVMLQKVEMFKIVSRCEILSGVYNSFVEGTSRIGTGTSEKVDATEFGHSTQADLVSTEEVYILFSEYCNSESFRECFEGAVNICKNLFLSCFVVANLKTTLYHV